MSATVVELYLFYSARSIALTFLYYFFLPIFFPIFLPFSFPFLGIKKEDPAFFNSKSSNFLFFLIKFSVPCRLIILIAHIIIAIRWMLIKILSAVINHHGRVITVVSDGCHPNDNIIRKADRKIKMRSYSFCDPNSIFHTPTYPLLPK